MLNRGLTTHEAEESRAKYGANTLTQLPPEPLWRKILNGFRDPMIMILLVALAVQVVLFLLGESEWFEPVGILVAILIANGVASVSEAKQEGKASALKAEQEAGELAKVLRDGRLVQLHASEVVVGDVLFLQAGDKLPADGEVVEGEIMLDQSALNGETEEAPKVPVIGGGYDSRDLLNLHYAYRGTVVCSGEAYLEVKVVGDATLFGQLAMEVQENTRQTPLQIKLGILAKQISTFGYIGAICIIVGVMGRTLLTGDIPSGFYQWVRLVMDAITTAVMIIVCAVPEGLPMLTSILLSFQSIKMARDNVLVRKINGVETAGSLSILFSDKTGTITEGRLSVTELVTGDLLTFTDFEKLSVRLEEEIQIGIGLNNSAIYSGGEIIGGNSTDRAMLGFLAACGEAEELDRSGIEKFEAFDSRKKYSSLTLRRGGRSVTYIKGAAERILAQCTTYLDLSGTKRTLTSLEPLMEYLDAQASRSMRLLAVARTDTKLEDGGLTLICVLSVRDDVRREAAEAIREVQQAGIQVVMVTGDRKETAVAIAKEAGLITAPTDLALTSGELAEKSDDELKELLPRLRVVSRALPSDKSRLVKAAQELNMVVGMTGDGVNDSPALKKADVGFAMGSGTEVAKEAGDITILDDNFLSIKKAILYGRTMFKSIRKFLIFQLTVNVSAVLICFIGPLLGENVIMTVVQLLLVNLVMDTLAAMAFGGEPPREDYMQELPVPRDQSIITGAMLGRVLISAAYITAICLSILFVPQVRALFGAVDATYLKSAVFATFMMAIALNGFHARTEKCNPFADLGGNRGFLLIMGLVFVMQFVFITFGGVALSVEPLNLSGWLICLILAALVLPLHSVAKKIFR